MKPLKIGAIVLLSAIALFSLSLGLKILLSKGNSSPAAVAEQKDNTNKESNEKLKTQTPLKWVEIESVQEESQPIVGESKKTGTENSALQKLLDEMKSLERAGLGLNPIIPTTQTQKTTETADGTKDLEEYSANVLDVWRKNSFTGEEFASIKKNKDGRVLSLEELIQESIQGGNSEALKLSFKTWQMLDERTVNDLKNISVGSQLLFSHQSMISWFQYHSQVAGKLGKENLSQKEINNLFNQYSEKAKIETPKFQQALVPIKKSFGSVFISEAQAQTEGSFYHFGGLVASYGDFCTNGFAVIIAGVKGGLLWIYYPVLTANPYLYKILAPSYYELGRALWGPGVCNKAYVNYAIGIAQILFFGSSATPL